MRFILSVSAQTLQQSGFPVARHKYRRKSTMPQNTHNTEYDCSAEHWRATGSAITCAQHPPRQLAARQCPFPECTARCEDVQAAWNLCLMLAPAIPASVAHLRPRRVKGGVSSAHRGTSRNVLPENRHCLCLRSLPMLLLLVMYSALVLEWLWRIDGRDGRDGRPWYSSVPRYCSCCEVAYLA